MSNGRITQYIFPAFAVTGSVKAETYSTHILNGTIQKVRFAGQQSPGSFWFAESGGAIFYNQNAIASGVATVEHYPLVVAKDSGGAVSTGSIGVNAVVNGPIYFAASGLTSGLTFGPITVFVQE